jgi:hypothetical protein
MTRIAAFFDVAGRISRTTDGYSHVTVSGVGIPSDRRLGIGDQLKHIPKWSRATQPNVMYVSPSRLEIVEDRIEGAPDLLVEVLSPGTSRRDRNEKLKLYAESGVWEYWIVDAVERQIEFLVNHSGTFHVVLPVDDRYRSAELPEGSSSTSESSGGSSTAICRIMSRHLA